MDNSDSTFRKIMMDIGGKSSLEREDPRWGQLFRCENILSLNGQEIEFIQLSTRLLTNNAKSGNLLMLLERTSSRLYQIVSAKYCYSRTSVNQTCNALHLSSLIFLYINSNLETEKV